MGYSAKMWCLLSAFLSTIKMVFCKLLVILLAATVAEMKMERPYYETNAKKTKDGHHIWGGDMILTDQQLALVSRGVDPRTARKDPNSRWPNGYIPFKISPELEVARDNIYEALSIWNDGTCVYFDEDADISPDVPHLVLQKTGTGCNSWVGIFNTTSTEQIVSLDDGCHEFVTVIIHELGHALGLWHEQDRLDRDDYLTIYTKNMASKDRVYFDDVEGDVDNYGTPYDYTSIMQYSVNAFTDNGRMTLVPKDPLAEAVMSHAKGPSFRDFKLVNLMYQCTSYCPDTKCYNGGYAAWNSDANCRCVCAPGFGGSTCSKRIAVEPSCQYTITSPTTIRTPNYPNTLPISEYCAWLVKAPRNQKAKVTFKTFNLLGRYEETNECEWDSLRFRKADLQSDDPGNVYCGHELENKSLTARKEMLLVLMTSEYGDYSTGFEATVTFV